MYIFDSCICDSEILMVFAHVFFVCLFLGEHSAFICTIPLFTSAEVHNVNNTYVNPKLVVPAQRAEGEGTCILCIEGFMENFYLFSYYILTDFQFLFIYLYIHIYI